MHLQVEDGCDDVLSSFYVAVYHTVMLYQVMHDEAVTTYPAIINQMTLGLNFLKKQLDVRPRIGWHIGEDAF